MEIAILLHDRFTAFAAVGPFQVLALMPGAMVKVGGDGGAPHPLGLATRHDGGLHAG